ncbi:MAG: Xaa-Pro peptidase family protein [Candidatus Norongarragalinales archaeon]
MRVVFDFKARVERLQREMRVDCAVITQVNHPEANAYYYSGSLEPLLAYVTKNSSVAFTTEDLKEKDFPQFGETHAWKKAKDFYKKFFAKNKVKSVGLDFSTEASRVGFRLMEKKAKVKIENYSRQLEGFRALKDEKEKKLIRTAQQATKKCVQEAEDRGLEGRTESEIAGFMEWACRRKGLALDSFPPIIATGTKTAIPHSTPSQEKISQMALIDCGATCGQYHGDFTTTRYWGKSKETKDAVEAVAEAKKAAERIAKPGTKGKLLARTAEQVIREYGFGKHSFKKAGLALGHSLGLKVHDGFKLEEVRLAKGMVFTIEPGIYVPKRFGVRFEDAVFL